jgi:hypothetical protein
MKSYILIHHETGKEIFINADKIEVSRGIECDTFLLLNGDEVIGRISSTHFSYIEDEIFEAYKNSVTKHKNQDNTKF